MESKKTAYLVVIFFGLFIFGISMNEVLSKYKFNKRAILTEATVLEINTERVARSTSIYQTITFLTKEGKSDTVVLGDIHNKYLTEGTKIQIYYDPQNSHIVSTGKLTNNYIGVLLGGLLMIFGLNYYRNEIMIERSRKKPSTSA